VTDLLQPETTYPAVVGRILVKLRQGRGLEQKDLAQRIGLAQSTWSRIERGESAFTMEQLAKAANVMETTPSSILAQADEAAEALREKGMIVSNERSRSAAKVGLALVVGAALGLLIATVLKNKPSA
jgi:transcriptional regulator with XRE-family HTH domain